MFTIGRRRRRLGDQWGDAGQTQAIYFTDGVELFRVNRWLDRPVEPRLAEVENCRSLECVLLTCADLARLPLRLVAFDGTAAADDAEATVDAVGAGVMSPPDLVSPVA